MDYANILVSVDLGPAAPDRVRVAAGLAHRFEATLIGAAAQKLPAVLLATDVYDVQQQDDKNAEEVRSLLAQAQDVFVRNAGDALRTDWRTALDEPTAHLVDQARAADLIVVSRHGADDTLRDVLGVPPGPVLMEAGRPILVVPPRIEHLKGRRIVVAWKDTPEARRAVSAALGFIRHADQVFVATTGNDARYEGAEDVAGHLARHGASVTTHQLKAAVADSDELIRFALKQDADLLVMGAYGHSRLREWMFGGVTRDILQTTPLCCLMSH